MTLSTNNYHIPTAHTVSSFPVPGLLEIRHRKFFIYTDHVCQ